jgi:quercetin dioxygenase-like cupin family protein
MGTYGFAYNVFHQPNTAPFLKVPGSYHASLVGSRPGEVTEIHQGTHINDNSEAYINLGPEFSMDVEGRRAFVKPGDVYVVPPGKRHGNFETPQGYSSVLIEGNESGAVNYAGQKTSYLLTAPPFAGQTLYLNA